MAVNDLVMKTSAVSQFQQGPLVIFRGGAAQVFSHLSAAQETHSPSLGRFVPDRACRGLLRLSLLLLLLLLDGKTLQANPIGGTVTQGSATFSSSGSQFTVNQTSPYAFIRWQNFNIGSGETTTFVQPSSSSVIWNQINDANPSQILGSLSANGLVVLQNANGFLVGGQAAISTHGLILTTASTPEINLSSGGPWSFNAPPPAARIVNYGQINVAGGGPAFLIANDIQNSGSISAPGGKIGLYAGQTVLVSSAPDGRGLSARVTLPTGSVDNEGRLVADAGAIVAQARTVNQNGLVQANSARNVNGTIELLASDSVNLGANSIVSAHGDATGISSGGVVTIRSDHSYSDQAGSTVNVAGGSQGGDGGSVELSAPHMNRILTRVDGQAMPGFLGGTLTIDPLNLWLASSSTDPAAPSDYSVVDINSFNRLSQIDVKADNNIALNTVWALPDQNAPASLSLTAGNNIALELNSGIYAGKNWSVSLTAGNGFIPTAAQPKPASGSDGIYLYGGSPQQFNSAYIQSQNGNINLWAANEIQVGWSGTANLPGQVNLGSGGITTTAGGSINVTTLYGDVNSGSNPAGYIYSAAAPYDRVDPQLGGISTAAGGDVTIAAGQNVISYLPSGSTSTAAADAGSGAFGSEAGNVTVTAGASIYGHYVLADGVGTITAGQNVGAANGNPFALSLTSGGWTVNAPNGNIYLQEVRNPNGVFNNLKSRFGSSPGQFLFTYNPLAYLNLSADGVYLTSLNVPRPYGPVPVLYPPILEINAAAGGVTLDGDVTLFPSSDQNLSITTTSGGNLGAVQNSDGSTYYMSMSDSGQTRWSTGAFSPQDVGALRNEPNESTPVNVNISGSMENLNLITTKATDLTVGGDMVNSGFSGENLQAADHTVITVAGQILNTSAYSFVDLNQAIPLVPVPDVPVGFANSWNSVFTLAVNPAAIAALQIPPNIPVAQWAGYVMTKVQIPPNTPLSQWASYVLLGAGLFAETTINGQLVGSNPGFVYDATTGRFGFAGPMASSTLSALTQPITILHLVNGQPVIDPNPGDHSPGRTYGQFETDIISWAPSSAMQALFTDSQDRPLPDNLQLGLRLGGPGSFDINAGSISLGNSYGILSCGVFDGAGGFGRYANLAPLNLPGAAVNVQVTGDLDMLTSTIAALGGGDVNVTSTGGSMDLGSGDLFGNSSASKAANHLAYGIYTTGGGNVNVNALGDIDINGSRIAAYNGGNISVLSQHGAVNVGNGTADLNSVYVAYVDPVTGQANSYQEDVFGSGIIANTLVPPQQTGSTLPPHAARLPGNITVATPQGDITAGTGGILQEALDGSITPGPTVTLTAGTPASGTPGTPGYSPGYAGNIDLGHSGVIGGTVNVSANGNIIGQVVSRQNSTINAAQNFAGTLLSGGSANVSGGGTVSGTIVGVGGANVSGSGGVTASVLGQNVSVNGGAAQSTLGSSAAPTATAQAAAAQQSSQSATQDVAGNNTGNDEDDKKKKAAVLVRRVSRVTVILPGDS